MGKEKGYNSNHVYYQAKWWSKKSYKNFLNDLEKVFKIVWWRGRKWNHIKRVFEVDVFSSSQNIDFPFYLKRFLELFSLFSFNIFYSYFSLSLFLCSVSWGLGSFDDIRGEKSLIQKLLFKWNGMDWLSVNIGGGRIFRNGVMHANMAKSWLWRWGSCEYIAGGRIFRSEGMHADIFNS
jgi:hypothetical protein